MRNCLASLMILISATGCQMNNSSSSERALLRMSLECISGNKCFDVSRGQGQIPIKIVITNNSGEMAEFPKEAFEDLFLYTKYSNLQSDLDYAVPVPPQDFSKRYSGTSIPPGKSIFIEDVIYPEYMEMVSLKDGPKVQRLSVTFSVPNIQGWESVAGLTANHDILYTLN